MKYRLLVALFAFGLCAELLAEDKPDYARVAFVGPGAGKTPVDRSQFILLVVEGPYLSYEKNPIPATGVVEYVNDLLKTKKVPTSASTPAKA